mmetsp:Transcript_7461/g.18904  ORF Transcript_7461/g.18904 Transcript_7461/m.18904 type:complete len:281 (-) Transcript_7461:185-1027(-)
MLKPSARSLCISPVRGCRRRGADSGGPAASLERLLDEVGELGGGALRKGDAFLGQERFQLVAQLLRLSRLHLDLVHRAVLKLRLVELQHVVLPRILAAQVAEAAQALEALKPEGTAAIGHERTVQLRQEGGVVQERPRRHRVHVLLHLRGAAHAIHDLHLALQREHRLLVHTIEAAAQHRALAVELALRAVKEVVLLLVVLPPGGRQRGRDRLVRGAVQQPQLHLNLHGPGSLVQADPGGGAHCWLALLGAPAAGGVVKVLFALTLRLLQLLILLFILGL